MRLAEHSVLFGTLTLLTLVTAHSPASHSGIIVDSYLPRGFNGTVHSLTLDVNQNVYASCHNPFDDRVSSAFLLKLDSKLHTVWSKKFETLPSAAATIAFSDTMGLYVVVPMKNSETDSIEIWVLEVDVADGKTIQAVQIDSLKLIAETGIKAFVSTAERKRPVIYVSYVEQRIAQGDTVIRVFKFEKMDSSVLFEQWKTEIYDASQVVVSHEIAEFLPDEAIYVAQITRKSSAISSDRATITMVHKNGSSVHIGSFSTMTGNAKISCLEIDDNGAVYFSETPSYLHHLSITSLNGSYRITKLWSDSSSSVAAMHVLRNGSLLYALTNSEVPQNAKGSTVAERVTVFVVYNYTGVILLTERHNETRSDVERHLRTFAMRNEAESPAIVVGGHLRLVGNDEVPGKVQISLGTYVSPVSAFEAQELVLSSLAPDVPDPEESTETRSQYRGFAIGMSCGVSAIVVLVGAVCYLQRRRPTCFLKAVSTCSR